MESKIYFVILNKPTLKFLEENGNTTRFIQHAEHFLTISDANKQIDILDNPEEYSVYKVTEYTEYSFELEE